MFNISISSHIVIVCINLPLENYMEFLIELAFVEVQHEIQYHHLININLSVWVHSWLCILCSVSHQFRFWIIVHESILINCKNKHETKKWLHSDELSNVFCRHVFRTKTRTIAFDKPARNNSFTHDFFRQN